MRHLFYTRNVSIKGVFRGVTKKINLVISFIPNLSTCLQYSLSYSNDKAATDPSQCCLEMTKPVMSFSSMKQPLKKHLVNVVYFPFTQNQQSLILPSSRFFPLFSLDSLKQLPCVSIEVCLKRNDKSKMSKSLVM